MRGLLVDELDGHKTLEVMGHEVTAYTRRVELHHPDTDEVVMAHTILHPYDIENPFVVYSLVARTHLTRLALRAAAFIIP